MNPKIPMRKLLFKMLAAGCLFSASAQAGTHSFFFNGPTDPTADGTLTVYRGGDNPTVTAEAGVWISGQGGLGTGDSGGSPFDTNAVNQATNGYFSITDDFGHRAAIVFDDFDAGLVIQAFTFTMDVRVGGGSTSPADGFSISFARSTDPVLSLTNGNGFASSEDGSAADAPEEGTTTGLAIAFDAFPNGGADIVALTIRVDNTVITNIPMPTLNGASNDITSLQTGDNLAGLGDLAWEPLFVQLTTNGLLNVAYKGSTLLTNFPVSFAASSGRLILAGRTGGFFEFQQVDNINIVTVPATSPAVGPAVAAASDKGFSITIQDSGAAMPTPSTLTVKLDGTNVVSSGLSVGPGTTSISKVGGVTTISYQQSAVFVSASTHSVEVIFSGTGFSGTVDQIRSFTAPTFVTLPLGLMTPVGSGDASKPGFKVRVFQVPNNLNWANGWQNMVQFDEQQIAGLINSNTAAGAAAVNLADLSLFTDNGYYDETNVINYSDNGNQGSFVPDGQLPGLPPVGSTSGFDDTVYEFTTFLEFPSAGLYTMGVQSDDGFRVTVGDRTGPDIGVRVLAPASVAGRYDGVPDAISYGEGFGGTLPSTPIIANAVLCDPSWPTSMPNNASALAGKIALIHRDPSGGVATHAIWAQAAGAIAVVVIDQDDQGQAGRLPGIWGGAAAVTVPVVMMEYKGGTNVYSLATTNANSPVIMSIGDDSSLRVSEFSGGRGAGAPTTFGVNVIQPGVYPLRMMYENGGGNASVEWWTKDATNGLVLINDLSSTNSVRLKAFRARSVTSGTAHMNPVVVSGNNVIISWTGEGELEEAFAVNGPWTKCPYQSNPATIPTNIPLNATFFRVRQY